jgi:hypothetical protein
LVATAAEDRLSSFFELESVMPSRPELLGTVCVDQGQLALVLAVQRQAQHQLTHQSSKCDP